MSQPRNYPGDLSMAEIEAAIGVDGAFQLSDKFGGAYLYVPMSFGDHHPICVALGRESAEQLAAVIGGGHFYVPKQASRRERVRRLRSCGALTVRQIAAETSFSERHVYRLLHDDEDGRQLGLFD